MKMSTKITKLAAFLGFIILAGCGSSDPYIKDAAKHLEDQNFNEMLEAAEQAIQNPPPSNGVDYYYKGVAIGELATEQPPGERTEDYRKVLDAFQKANEKFNQAEERPGIAENLPVSHRAFWRTELNSAIEIVNSDSLTEAVGLDVAVAHAKNATVIIPDSVLSWKVLSEIEVRNDNIPGAIDALTEALQRMDKPEANDFRRLALFHRNQSEVEEAIKILEQGKDLYPDNIEMTQDLTDAYLTNGQIDKGIETISELIEKDPENVRYRLAYGTNVYQAALRINNEYTDVVEKLFSKEQELNQFSGSSEEKDELQKEIEQLQQKEDSLESEMRPLTNRAEEQLKKVLEIEPNNFQANNTLGIIYQNRAAEYFTKRNNTLDNQKAADFDQQGTEHLRTAMGYFEKAVEIQPDNVDVWRSLFQIYTAFNMSEKADEAAKKAGL